MTNRPTASPCPKCQFSIGDRVRIAGDGDGSSGVIGVIGNVYKSGRCRVDLPCGGFRNLKPICLERVE